MKILGNLIKSRKVYFAETLKQSDKALEELRHEHFNSKTLRTLFYDPRFKSAEPDTFMIINRETGEPYKVYSLLNLGPNKKDIWYNVYIYTKEAFSEIEGYGGCAHLGEKNFHMIKNQFGKLIMDTGFMNSKADDKYIGIGIRADQVHIDFALKNGITTIPRESYPNAILYHLKMGFEPVQKLVRVRSKKKLDKLMAKIYEQSKDIKEENFTPIVIEKKGILGKRYYLDKNTTKAVATLRAVKKHLAETGNLRPRFINNADNIDLELKGDNLQVWKNMLNGKPMFENTKY